MNRLVVGVPQMAAEAVASHLIDEGAAGVELRDRDTLVQAVDGQVEIVAYMSEADVAQRVAALDGYVQALRSSGVAVDPCSWRTEVVPEGDWHDRWKEFFTACRVGARLVVCPPWQTWSATPRDIVVVVSPGQAFGTGTHASTRLCLRALERLSRVAAPPRAVLDVGCGSGILGAAAALLWPDCRVTAVDVDPLAVEATERIVGDNGLGDRLRVRCLPLAETGGTWDLVLANLQADVLSAHRSVLVGLLRTGGHLVLSGVLAADAPHIAEGFCSTGEVESEYSEDEGEWRALTLRRM